MKSTDIIIKLSAIISEVLTHLIDNDYVYLEIPFYINPGDILIWKGTEDFLKQLPYKCLYRASAVSYEERESGARLAYAPRLGARQHHDGHRPR